MGRIVIAGLGPAGPESVTAAVTAAIGRIPRRYLRTQRHPSASVVPDAITFDHVYESADSFDEVYRQIAETLIAAAGEYGEILYLVPGSPLVLERTVRHLLDDKRVECDVLASLSFLDIAYARLGIDPVETGVRLIDGHEFTTAAAGYTGPMLVAHCHANWVLSEIKLAVEEAVGDEPVVILQRLGSSDEAIIHTTWADLDRTVEADHLTSIYIPSLGHPVAGELVRFYDVVRRLRSDCPWDREQTHRSLARYAIEETYELVEAISQLDDNGDRGDDDLIGELGDVLLQVVLHSAIAEEEGRFSLGDVAREISEKMIRRHPHVFGDVVADDAAQVAANWQMIKAAERAADAKGSLPRRSVLDTARPGQPTLRYAAELLTAAESVGFISSDPHYALGKVAEELAEVTECYDDADTGHLVEELGDLMMAVVSASRLRDIDPDLALRQASTKFVRRFKTLERLAAEQGIETTTCAEHLIARLWDEVKAAERSSPHV